MEDSMSKTFEDILIEDNEEKINCLDELRRTANGHEKILAYSKEMFDLSRKININQDLKEYCKDIYIKNILKYGFYIKGRWENNGHTARKYFMSALRINPNLPIANYRIGHILFKNEEFVQAIGYFDKALNPDTLKKIPYYAKLDDVQSDNAKKIIAYCSLQSFLRYKESAKSNNNYVELNHLIAEYASTENSIVTSRIKMDIVGEAKPRIITNDERDEILESQSVVILDGFSMDIALHYSIKGGNFKNTIELKPESFWFIKDIFLGKELGEYITTKDRKTDSLNHINNAINQKIRRLRNQLEEIGLTSDIFKIIKKDPMTAKVETNLKIIILSRIED